MFQSLLLENMDFGKTSIAVSSHQRESYALESKSRVVSIQLWGIYAEFDDHRAYKEI